MLIHYESAERDMLDIYKSFMKPMSISFYMLKILTFRSVLKVIFKTFTCEWCLDWKSFVPNVRRVP